MKNLTCKIYNRKKDSSTEIINIDLDYLHAKFTNWPSIFLIRVVTYVQTPIARFHNITFVNLRMT